MGNDLNAEPFNEADKPVKSTKGRSDPAGGNGNPSGASNEACVEHSSRQGTVVIRATVEHIGLAGDTEMTVTVRWPASSFCIQPCAQAPAQGGQVAGPANVPPNGPLAKNFEPGPLFGDSDQDPNPAPLQIASQEGAQNNGETAPLENSGQPYEASELPPTPASPKKKAASKKRGTQRPA